jgi:nitrogen fixation NifU-like protein
MRDYSPQVVEHFSHPRNLGELPAPDVTAEVANPCCGDRIRLYARVRDGRVTACRFLAYGCAAALAVASLLTEAIAGQPIDDLPRLDEARVAALAGGLAPGQRHCAALGRDVLLTLSHNYRTAHPKGAPV